VQISDGNKMLGSRRFSQVIVSETGHMAVMDTMSPTLFVALKKRLSKSMRTPAMVSPAFISP
jgi:tryptophan 2,3-dioxygenase